MARRQEDFNHFRLLNYGQLIKAAINDPVSQQFTLWLPEAREKTLLGRPPSKDVLDSYLLTERGYYALTDFILVPGGGANPLALRGVESRIHELEGRGIPYDQIYVVLGGHGPGLRLYTGLDDILEDPQIPEGLKGRLPANFAWHANLLYAELCCGLGTINEIGANLEANKRYLEQKYPSINVVMLEALIGQVNSRATDLIEVFNVHNNRDITYKLGPSEETFTPTELDQYFRKLMDRGSIVIGAVCIDGRMGFTSPHESVKKIDINKLGNSTYGGALGHTEPFGTFLDDDPRTLMFSHYVTTHDIAIVRGANWRGPKIASHSNPLIINIPKELLMEREFAGQFYSQTFRLLSNLRKSTYGPGIFGQTYTVPCILTDEGLAEVKTNGLEFVFGDTKAGRLLENVNTVLPILNSSRKEVVVERLLKGEEVKMAVYIPNLNPGFKRYVPGSSQLIGHIFPYYLR